MKDIVINYGYLSLLPPIVSIFLAFKTKQVFPSLMLGLFSGCLVIVNFNPFLAFFKTLEIIVSVFNEAGNTKTIAFCVLVGAIIFLLQSSGAVNGFVELITNFLNKYKHKEEKFKVKLIQFLAMFVGLFLFIETNISCLVTGTIFRPIFDKYKVSREKLSFLVDTSAAPSSIIMPFNGWGAYLIGLLALENISDPFGLVLGALPLYFYPILIISFTFLVIFIGFDFPEMKKANLRVEKTGKLLNDNSTPLMSQEMLNTKLFDGAKNDSFLFISSIVLLVIFMPIMLIYTGWQEINDPSFLIGNFVEYFKKASGSSAVLYSVTLTIVYIMSYIVIKKYGTFKNVVDGSLKGMEEVLSLGLLIMLAFGLSSICEEVGTGEYVASIAKETIDPVYIPFLLYLITSSISFSTGSSWGSFAIMVPIAIAISKTLNLDMPLIFATVISGGLFGDHCSPLSDTTILSSMTSGTDHLDHVNTQLPYAIFIGIITAILYLICGFLM